MFDAGTVWPEAEESEEPNGVSILARVLTADDPYADNESEAQKVRIAPLAVRVEETPKTPEKSNGNGRKSVWLRLTVPPHSLAGLTLED